jgi:hypothetical protein
MDQLPLYGGIALFLGGLLLLTAFVITAIRSSGSTNKPRKPAPDADYIDGEGRE